MAFNLGRIMRSLLGAGKPRYLAVLAERLWLVYLTIWSMLIAMGRFQRPTTSHRALGAAAELI